MTFTSNLVREVLKAHPELVDPKDIARHIVENTPATDYFDLLLDTLPPYIRETIRLDRNRILADAYHAGEARAHPAPTHQRGQSKAKVQEHHTWQQELRANRVKVPGSGWKIFNEFTTADVRAFSQRYQDQSIDLYQKSDQYARLAKEMDRIKAKTVKEVSDKILDEIFEGAVESL